MPPIGKGARLPVRALVLGAGGQVGRALAAAAPLNYEVFASLRADCDVCDEGQVEAAVAKVEPDLVLNATAYTAVDRAEREPDAAHRLNATAPGLIARVARKAGARTIHISTDFVFLGNVAAPRAPGDPTGPESTYARTKLEGEREAAFADPDALIVRTSWVYAAKGINFVNTMIRLMGERDTVQVVSDQVGTPTWAPSLAQALWKLAGRARGIYHFTDSGVASWYDFAVAIEEEARAAGLTQRPVRVLPITTKDYPTPARRPAYSVLDKSATWPLLGGPAPHWRVNLRANMQELKAG